MNSRTKPKLIYELKLLLSRRISYLLHGPGQSSKAREISETGPTDPCVQLVRLVNEDNVVDPNKRDIYFSRGKSYTSEALLRRKYGKMTAGICAVSAIVS